MAGTDYGADTDDVQARVPYPTFTAGTTPSTTTIDGWINEAEAKLNNALRSVGVSVPITEGSGVEELKSLTILYAEALTRQALAAAGGDGGNDDGKAEMAEFKAVLMKIQEDPGITAARYLGGAPSGTRRMRSHLTNDVDGRASTNSDFDAEFNRADLEDQW